MVNVSRRRYFDPERLPVVHWDVDATYTNAGNEYVETNAGTAGTSEGHQAARDAGRLAVLRKHGVEAWSAYRNTTTIMAKRNPWKSRAVDAPRGARRRGTERTAD